MNVETFRASLAQAAPPAGLAEAMQGLWWDAKGDWARAHACAQAQDDAIGAAVHAYLHRKEGDIPNARYWYGRSGRPMPVGTLDTEWMELVEELLP
ncbi:MAG: hypothetical protein BGP12_03985 [Rhodospirillales bacterium 70-18]|nr:hypothetical protein [Rhodospirillales bacterium]OJY64905.1 MAG: hypothetical protein BGP12_03985 [Rhodospirillales bacterium 70-18]